MEVKRSNRFSWKILSMRRCVSEHTPGRVQRWTHALQSARFWNN